jgi:hypothetical protein
VLDLLSIARRACIGPVIQCPKIVGLLFSARRAYQDRLFNALRCGFVIQCPQGYKDGFCEIYYLYICKSLLFKTQMELLVIQGLKVSRVRIADFFTNVFDLI